MSAKHPKPEPISPQALLSGAAPPSFAPYLFRPIDGELIKKNSIRTSGGAGVSQQEDALWHKMVSAHKDASAGCLCEETSYRVCRPKPLEALLANRGIAIKCPELRPVGVGDGKTYYW